MEKFWDGCLRVIFWGAFGKEGLFLLLTILLDLFCKVGFVKLCGLALFDGLTTDLLLALNFLVEALEIRFGLVDNVLFF